MACSHQWHRLQFPMLLSTSKQQRKNDTSWESREGWENSGSGKWWTGRKEDKRPVGYIYIEKNNTAAQAKITVSFQCQNEMYFYEKDIQVWHTVMHSLAGVNTQVVLSSFRSVNRTVFLHWRSVVTHLAQIIYFLPRAYSSSYRENTFHSTGSLWQPLFWHFMTFECLCLKPDHLERGRGVFGMKLIQGLVTWGFFLHHNRTMNIFENPKSESSCDQGQEAIMLLSDTVKEL